VRLVRKEPGLSAAEMGERLGVSRERVRQLLEALGYKWQPGCWRKAKR
jgi:predicted ArsR family transcriptional regulator